MAHPRKGLQDLVLVLDGATDGQFMARRRLRLKEIGASKGRRIWTGQEDDAPGGTSTYYHGGEAGVAPLGIASWQERIILGQRLLNVTPRQGHFLLAVRYLVATLEPGEAEKSGYRTPGPKGTLAGFPGLEDA